MMHLPMMRRRTSPMPIVRTPGFCKGTSLHALCASRDFSDDFSIDRRTAILATVFSMFAEVKSGLHLFASRQEGP